MDNSCSVRKYWKGKIILLLIINKLIKNVLEDFQTFQFYNSELFYRYSSTAMLNIYKRTSDWD